MPCESLQQGELLLLLCLSVPLQLTVHSMAEDVDQYYPCIWRLDWKHQAVPLRSYLRRF